MAKSHPINRGRPPLVVQVELLEDRRLLSGLGYGHLRHEPFTPAADFSAPIPFSTTPSDSFSKEVSLAQRHAFGGEPVAPPSESAGQGGREHDAKPVGTKPGAPSVGPKNSQAQPSHEGTAPPGRSLETGRAHGFANANERAAAGGKQSAGTNPRTAEPKEERIPQGLLVAASAPDAPDSAPTTDSSSAPVLGQVPSAPPATGLNLGSASARTDRPNSKSYGRTSLLLSDLPFSDLLALSLGTEFDAEALGIPSNRMPAPAEMQSGESPATSEPARQGRAQAVGLSDQPRGEIRLVREPGDRDTVSALPSPVDPGHSSPETGLEAESASYPAQALLRELEKLRDQLQSAGESAIGWLFDRDISEWILLTLVVAVAVEITRRELWHAEAEPSLVDGEGFQSPWMV